MVDKDSVPLIAGFPAGQRYRDRAIADAKPRTALAAVIKGAVSIAVTWFVLRQLVSHGYLTDYDVSSDKMIQAMFSGLIGPLVLVLVTLFWNLIRAPFKQRNEYLAELLSLKLDEVSFVIDQLEANGAHARVGYGSAGELFVQCFNRTTQPFDNRNLAAAMMFGLGRDPNEHLSHDERRDAAREGYGYLQLLIRLGLAEETTRERIRLYRTRPSRSVKDLVDSMTYMPVKETYHVFSPLARRVAQRLAASGV